MDINTFKKEITHAHERPKLKSRKIFLVVLLCMFLVSVFICGPRVWMFFSAKGYQAVFFENGQVYFGKLSTSGSWLKLSDIYYLQANTTSLQQSQAVKNDSSNIQLVKLGSELHGPADYMYITRDKVLFWENLKDDSRVVDAINKYKAN